MYIEHIINQESSLFYRMHTQLTKKEKFALENYDSLTWKEFNLEELFGKATRGKRLKSADRISGDLPLLLLERLMREYQLL